MDEVVFRSRLQRHVLAPPPDVVVITDEEEEELVLGHDDDDWKEVDSEEDDEESAEDESQEASGGGEEEEYFDSDESSDDEEEDDDEIFGGDEVLLARLRQLRPNFVPKGRFLGPAPRFATAGNTAGFMRVFATEESQQHGGGGEKQILVFYRYTRFRAAEPESGGGGVRARGSTREHQVRFVLPHAGDAARSLAWAASALVPLIYPGRSTKQLQALWSALASQVRVPPRAARVEVLVDVGILRLPDCTPPGMEGMAAALQGKMLDPWPAGFVGMELRLPEPVLCGGGTEGEATDDDDDDGGGDTDCCERRSAKRRKVAADFAAQECAVCLEPLESDLAAWPGCSRPHVFHGGCLERSLKECETCPICRRKLYVEGA
ncbi:uncharacterized protein LOC100833950 [Brachypodium distachyon]|uniref:uncharacterized protein LOC100833950 n=1 Tax=Brachypodium distachyon TaxID=15368 RepID=UPI0001C75EE7|nr:uncharacterized protein LOC100833950 [Brachypodium distachyon]|eukprot:XP_003560474.1 uncharacterized protein LOC100833950 [Brachypodium distachyon]